MPLRAEVVGAAVWEFIVRPVGVWLFLGAGAVLSAAARYVEDLTEFEQGALYVTSGVFLLLAFAVAAILYRRRAPQSSAQAASHEEPAVPLAPSPVPAPARDIEVVILGDKNRLQELYTPLAESIQFAISVGEYLCSTPACWAGDFEKNRVIASLLARSFVAPCRAASATVAQQIRAPGTLNEKEFAGVVDALKNFLDVHYDNLLHWTVAGGTALMGLDRLVRGENYSKLYGYHQKAVAAISDIRERSDLRRIADNLPTLSLALPAPQKRDTSLPLSDDPQELYRIVHWEGTPAVIGREWSGALRIKRWEFLSANPVRIEFLCTRVVADDEEPIFRLRKIQEADFGDMLTSRRIVYVSGTISDVDKEWTILEPVSITGIEGDP